MSSVQWQVIVFICVLTRVFILVGVHALVDAVGKFGSIYAKQPVGERKARACIYMCV